MEDGDSQLTAPLSASIMFVAAFKDMSLDAFQVLSTWSILVLLDLRGALLEITYVPSQDGGNNPAQSLAGLGFTWHHRHTVLLKCILPFVGRLGDSNPAGNGVYGYLG